MSDPVVSNTATGAFRATSALAMQRPPHSEPEQLLNVRLLSGRQRRHIGKQKQAAKLAAAQQKIQEQQQQLASLQGIIATLQAATTSNAAPVMSNPTIFDIFEDTSATVGTQTDISVNHWQPDVFVAAADLPTRGAAPGDVAAGNGLTQKTARAERPGAEAVASAAPGELASGLDVHHQHHPSPVVPFFGEGTSVTTPGCHSTHGDGPYSSDQPDIRLELDSPLDDGNHVATQFGRLCGTAKDVNSHNLAKTVEHVVDGPCRPLCGEGTSGTTPFDAISRDVQLDLNSQNLAQQPEKSCALKDFNSQYLDSKSVAVTASLAKEPEGALPGPLQRFELLQVECNDSETLHNASGCTAQASLRACDAISEDAMSTLKDFNSHELACANAFYPGAEAVASAATGGKGVGSPRTTPSTPGSSSPGSSSCAAKDFNSQNLANTVERLGNGISSEDTMACCPAGPIKATEPPAMSCSQQASISVKNDNFKTSVRVGCDDNSEKQSQCGQIATAPQCGPRATVHIQNSTYEHFGAEAGASAANGVGSINCGEVDVGYGPAHGLHSDADATVLASSGGEAVASPAPGTSTSLHASQHPIGSDEAIRECQIELQRSINALLAFMQPSP